MSTKGIGTPENKELAFTVWREFGGHNIPKVLDAINKRHGLRLTAPTLYSWAREGGWQERLTQINTAQATTAERAGTIQEQTFNALWERKAAYEKYFGTLGIKPDNQAQYAYNNVIETLIKIAKLIAPKPEDAPEDMKGKLKEIMEAEYGITR